MRKSLTHPWINVELGSVDMNGSASSVPQHKPGDVIYCDSGLYVYGSANGAVDEGAVCKFVEGVWDFDEVTTAESGSTETQLGICVTDGGLADNQWGWFWRGLGTEYAYVTDVNADVQLTTHTNAGELSTGGDNVFGLFSAENNASAGLTLVRSGRLICTNTTIAAT